MNKNKHGIVRIKPGDILGGKDGLDWSAILLLLDVTQAMKPGHLSLTINVLHISSAPCLKANLMASPTYPSLPPEATVLDPSVDIEA